MTTSSLVWLQLCLFSKTYGLQNLWHSPNIDQLILNPNDHRKLLNVFPNFLCGLIIQGKDVTESLHGPFSVRDVIDVTAYVYPFVLSDKKTQSEDSRSFYMLITYFKAATAELLDNDVRMRLYHFLKQWSSKFRVNEDLTELEIYNLQAHLNQFTKNEVIMKKRTLTAESVKNAIESSFSSLLEHVKQAQLDVCITLWSPNHLARLYNLLAFEALQHLSSLQKVNLDTENSVAAQPWLTHDEMHTLLRMDPLSILAVEELSAVFFLPSQCYIFYLTNAVDLPSFLKEVSRNVTWEDVSFVFFLLHEISMEKTQILKQFCDVLAKYHPNIKKSAVINVSWIKKSQVSTLFHVFNDLIVESILNFVTG